MGLKDTLKDAFNRLVRKQDLTRELAAPSLTGVRTVFADTIAAGLTPQRLASLLQRAAQGDAHDYLTLAEEMEEKEPHYASVLGTRKRAVKKLPIQVEAASDDANDVKIADAVRELTKRAGFKALLEDQLDALGKGYAVDEIIWDRGPARWYPKEYKWRDPRFFQFDRETQTELRLKDEADLAEGVELPPYKFIVHLPRLKSGLPIRGGLARLVAWSYMAKQFTFKDWLAFAEVFGMPLRVGKYNSNATDDQIAILKSAVANLGSDAAAVLPDSMIIEFVQHAQAAGSEKFFLVLAEWIDKQVSKAVLGQTMTADDGSSQAQAKVHDEVRADITEADAEQLAETLNQQLIRPFVDLNFGPQESYPTLTLFIKEPEDLKVLTEGLKVLVPMGFRVEQSVIRDKFNLPDPDPNAKPEDLLGAPAATAQPQPPAAPALNHARFPYVPQVPGVPGFTRRSLGEGGCPHCATALNAEAAEDDPADHIAMRMAREASPMMDAMIDQVREYLNSSGSLQEARDGILKLYPRLDGRQMGQLMMQALTAANLTGRAEVVDGD